MNCEHANRGRDDFNAGKKDEDQYLKEPDYRRGWQLARLAREAEDLRRNRTETLPELPKASQSLPVSAVGPTETPTKAPDHALRQKGRGHATAAAVEVDDGMSLFSSSNEEAKTDTGEISPKPAEPLALAPTPPDLPIVETAPAAEPAPKVPDDPEQMNLLEVPPDWKGRWTGMPDFEQRDESPWQTVPVHFRSRADRV